ncbi:universal stress protein [Rubrobacter tropicus]|uniref:Universal stress protein n=1 Tax=Rubrobacter tropicus TaxID=2653851 RepID=A0A6G8QCT5_9ACTN|nr:universal stress protein [Rubrobacter tropicus]QIN84324.1 universal stress protein [Rubrobacter tropicus]
MFPTRILVATNGSREAERALEAAVDLATGTGSELEIAYVVSTVTGPPHPSAGVGVSKEAHLERKRLLGFRLLEDQKRRVEDLGGSVAASHYREGKPEKEVVELAREIEAGLIVTGGNRRPWFARVFGAGFSTTVLRKADRPVLVVGKRETQGSTVPK